MLSTEQHGISAVKTCFRERPGYIVANIATEEGIGVLSEQDWDVVIHCAAWRVPEACDRDPAGESVRAEDAHLSMGKLKAFGFPDAIPFQ